MAEIKKGLNLNPKSEGEIKKLVDSIFQQSEDYRRDYERDWEDAYKLYYGYVDLRGRDPNLLQAAIPRAFTLTETIFPEDVKAMLGQKPYFPIEPKLEAWRGNTEAMEKLLDCASDEDNLFYNFALGLKQRRICGNMIVEPYWRFEIKEKGVNKEKKVKGFVVGAPSESMQYVDQGLSWRIHSPWNVGVDPYKGMVDRMRWAYLKQPVSRTEMTAMMKLGKYLKKPDELIDDENSDMDKVKKYIEADLGYGASAADSDMGELVRIFLPMSGRYIEVWGSKDMGIHVIRDTLNPYPFVPIVNFPNTLDPFPERFYHIGEIRPNAQMFAMLNDAYSQLFNSQQQSMDPPLLYPEGWIDPQGMVAAPGQRTPYNPIYADRIQQSIFPLPLKGLDKDAYEIPDRISQIIDGTAGVPAPAQGQFPERKELAYTVRKVTEGADSRTEVKVKIALDSMRELAKKSLKVLGDNITEDIVAKTLGDEARYYVMKNPDDIPGGYEFRFKGPDVIADSEAKMQVKIAMFDRAQPDIANRAEFYKILLEGTDAFTQEETERITNITQQGMPAEQGVAGAPGMSEQPGQSIPTAAPNAPPQAPQTAEIQGGV